MPQCEYYKCNKVADTTKIGLLRKWESYHFKERPNHTQEISLCRKHRMKIEKQLCLQTTKLKENK